MNDITFKIIDKVNNNTLLIVMLSTSLLLAQLQGDTNLTRIIAGALLGGADFKGVGRK